MGSGAKSQEPCKGQIHMAESYWGWWWGGGGGGARPPHGSSAPPLFCRANQWTGLKRKKVSQKEHKTDKTDRLWVISIALSEVPVHRCPLKKVFSNILLNSQPIRISFRYNKIYSSSFLLDSFLFERTQNFPKK